MDLLQKNISLEKQENNIENYLEFSDGEKEEVIKQIEQIVLNKGVGVKEKQIDFPTDQRTIEDWIYDTPQCFKEERVLEVALNNQEYVIKLINELVNRKKYDYVFQVLHNYAGTPTFEHCVKIIENNLRDKSSRDSILMMLSDKIAECREEKVAFDEFFKHMFERPESASRNLLTYLKFLNINDDKEIKKLLGGKTLLLIGGGIAPIKDQLLSQDIDCQVTNIEPLLTEEHKGNADYPISKNFYDIRGDLKKYDEVWSANNSLPTYAFNPEQVRIFYKKALAGVSQGGHLRIVPVSGFSDSITPSMRLSRFPVNNESIKCVDLLKQRQDLFLVEEFETPMLKSSMGRKSNMNGVDIKVIGDTKDVKIFLDEFEGNLK
ncbi:MAG: hypothetical protein ABIA91_02310 [Patescibacteria group bacterium]